MTQRFGVSTLSKKRKLDAAALRRNMNLKGMVVVLALLFYAAIVQGFPMFRGGRCLCLGPRASAVKVAHIEKVAILYPSNSCDHMEVIVTLKAQKGQRCLDPRSKQASSMIKQAQRKSFLKKKTL
ncbi:C-X-C motif chemokine 11 isoform X2 [Perognathus longimembris pacificus]|uniref:C-X-C motif chemokine 11 isoform X2 n=1 Tax=Perognathus longimembris pacificus TaxID=214514 RepID=UPI002018EA74|nr:C-X-C motif chemokine 11 isoform X2 [Perognathus longimembris pacificus]